jgi:BirA family biotin operon repressor/biotin-[acetyl-CoA-carboxylase] ligase
VVQSSRSPVPPQLVLDQVGSTNREAFALAEAGASGPLWIMARRQSAGRGRADRQWVSVPGNLHASLVIRLACPPTALPQLSLLTGIAVLDAIRQATGGGPAGLRLKWPNDVLVGPAKCAGILIESLTGRDAITAAIGIGIDLAWHPADLGRPATDLSEHGCKVSPEAMLESLTRTMQRWLGVWDDGRGFPAVRQAWLERAGPVGEMCRVDTGQERIAGTFAGIDPAGALVICDGLGQRRTVTFGDVAVLAAAASAEASEEAS